MKTKEQIIATILQESNCPRLYRKVIVHELGRRLPETEMKTCSDFKMLAVQCCESCHTGYPHYDMDLDQTRAWVCCTVAEAQLRNGWPDCYWSWSEKLRHDNHFNRTR